MRRFGDLILRPKGSSDWQHIFQILLVLRDEEEEEKISAGYGIIRRICVFAPISGLSLCWFDIPSIMSVIYCTDSPGILSDITFLNAMCKSR